jgi:hypothetical protein
MWPVYVATVTRSLEFVDLLSRWVGRVTRTETRDAYEILVGIPEGKRPLERHRYGWEDTIKIDVGHDMRV